MSQGEWSLSREMEVWEIHALRNLTAALMFSVELLDGHPDEGHFTPGGVMEVCREAYAEFGRQRLLAFTDTEFRRAVIRRNPC